MSESASYDIAAFKAAKERRRQEQAGRQQAVSAGFSSVVKSSAGAISAVTLVTLVKNSPVSKNPKAKPKVDVIGLRGNLATQATSPDVVGVTKDGVIVSADWGWDIAKKKEKGAAGPASTDIMYSYDTAFMRVPRTKVKTYTVPGSIVRTIGWKGEVYFTDDEPTKEKSIVKVKDIIHVATSANTPEAIRAFCYSNLLPQEVPEYSPSLAIKASGEEHNYLMAVPIGPMMDQELEDFMMERMTRSGKGVLLDNFDDFSGLNSAIMCTHDPNREAYGKEDFAYERIKPSFCFVIGAENSRAAAPTSSNPGQIGLNIWWNRLASVWGMLDLHASKAVLLQHFNRVPGVALVKPDFESSAKNPQNKQKFGEAAGAQANTMDAFAAEFQEAGDAGGFGDEDEAGEGPADIAPVAPDGVKDKWRLVCGTEILYQDVKGYLPEMGFAIPRWLAMSIVLKQRAMQARYSGRPAVIPDGPEKEKQKGIMYSWDSDARAAALSGVVCLSTVTNESRAILTGSSTHKNIRIWVLTPRLWAENPAQREEDIKKGRMGRTEALAAAGPHAAKMREFQAALPEIIKEAAEEESKMDAEARAAGAGANKIRSSYPAAYQKLVDVILAMSPEAMVEQHLQEKFAKMENGAKTMENARLANVLVFATYDTPATPDLTGIINEFVNGCPPPVEGDASAKVVNELPAAIVQKLNERRMKNQAGKEAEQREHAADAAAAEATAAPDSKKRDRSETEQGQAE